MLITIRLRTDHFVISRLVVIASQIPRFLSKINVVTKNNLVCIIIPGMIRKINPAREKIDVMILATNALNVFWRSMIPSTNTTSLLSSNLSTIITNPMLNQAENNDKITLKTLVISCIFSLIVFCASGSKPVFTILITITRIKSRLNLRTFFLVYARASL